MKFGKQLEKEAIERWRSFYVNYKLLKKVLKKGSANERSISEAQETFDIFDSLLKLEMQKCSSFFVEKMEEIEMLLGVYVPGKVGEEDVLKIAQAYLELGDLRRYAFLNYVAVTKAIKKRNKIMKKILGLQMRPSSTLNALLPQSFFSSSKFELLISKAETVLGVSGSEEEELREACRNTMCPICLEEIEKEVVLKCNHRFCSSCIASLVAYHFADVLLVNEDACSTERRGSSALLQLSNCPVCEEPQLINLENSLLNQKIAEMMASKAEVAKSPQREVGLTVVLDLDHTMIFSVPCNDNGLNMLSKNQKVVEGLQVWTLQMSHVPFPVKVFVRPGLKEFLASLQERSFEVIVFTAGIEPYACPIIDKIEHYASVHFKKRLYRQSTTRSPYHPTVKDLLCLGTNMAKTVLIDDNPLSFSFQPFNGIPALPFTAHVSEGENYLVHMLLPVLVELQREEDVRPHLKEKYNMHGWFAKYGVTVPLENESADDLFSTDLLIVNLDDRLCEFDCFQNILLEIAPDLLDVVSDDREGEHSIEAMNVVFAELQRRGYGPGKLVQHLSKMKMTSGAIDLLRNAHYSGVESIVCGGSNTIFATRILTGSKVWKYVSSLITNHAQFVHAPIEGQLLNEIHDTSSDFRLVVKSQDRRRSCNSCSNVCKGIEYMNLKSQKQVKQVILVADNFSDLCIARLLQRKDIIFTSNFHMLKECEELEAQPQVRFCPEEKLLESVNNYIRSERISALGTKRIRKVNSNLEVPPQLSTAVI